jgi:predicted transcriptional regulator
MKIGWIGGWGVSLEEMKAIAVAHAPDIGYAEGFSMSAARMIQIGINCRICPRAHCDQRAHQAAILTQPVDALRRGVTRYDV